ncbi:MAG: class IV adenylate cyclase [Pirellulaceae bacterium]
MLYEVENKFPVPDLAIVEQRLGTYGVRFGEAVEQIDHYFAHPARDFVQTDEALRLRQIGDRNFVTYKGPKIDQATKTRQELELPLAVGQDLVVRYVQLLRALGFRSVAEVRKLRRSGSFLWQQWQVEATLDEVAGLGRFVELEIQVDADRLAAAQAGLLALAAELGLNQVERRSYLQMLLASY